MGGGSPSMPVGSPLVELRFLCSNAEFLGLGCLCDGWGAADALSATSGYANVGADGGVVNMILESLSRSSTETTSGVTIGGTLRVTHHCFSSSNPYLYQVDVATQNISTSTVDARYRRVMNWDAEPTPFRDVITIQGFGTTSSLLFDSDDGFVTANPLGDPSALTFSGNTIDQCCLHHGALFDLGVGLMPAGQSVTFQLFYGAAPTEPAAANALSAVRAQVYSLAQADQPGPVDFGISGESIQAQNELLGTPSSGIHQPHQRLPGGAHQSQHHPGSGRYP